MKTLLALCAILVIFQALYAAPVDQELEQLPEKVEQKPLPPKEGDEPEAEELGESEQPEEGPSGEGEELKGPETEQEEDEEEDAELNPDLFEGDLKLSKEDIDQLKGNTISKKDTVAAANRRWPGARVPYTTDRSFNDRKRMKLLNDAIKQFNQKTCVRFVKKKPTDKNFIIFSNRKGCYSTGVGKKVRPVSQTISIGRGCTWIGTVIHEMLHAIGFFHEHTRLDRDQYITINWQNIQKRRESQFQKYNHGEGDYLGEPYDYDSVMHYPRTGFGITVNGAKLPTIVPKDKPFRKIGQRKGFSPIDLRQVNKMYKCTKFTSKY
eukprot:Seg1491.8 transcript_id=Seg1491.8/GoldUCD/mRNA.D3Y31 product="Zinc metalloproteinase nas-4" protein_id=Seg1491.8/GoldUCD/D3Y31